MQESYKKITIMLLMPITLHVVATDISGEVEIVSIDSVDLPELSDLNDYMTTDNMYEIDEKFYKS